MKYSLLAALVGGIINYLAKKKKNPSTGLQAKLWSPTHCSLAVFTGLKTGTGEMYCTFRITKVFYEFSMGLWFLVERQETSSLDFRKR